ncbi:MAG: glycosyltransferase family 9 protein [Ignavibacteriae bacterium]|nr:glycosyltransferase family 9 protein [Ignavibacteriota bacterium]
MPPSRVLFLAEGQLGDLLLLTPALRAMKKSFPSASIAVLVVERYASSNPRIDFGNLTATSIGRERSVLGTNSNVDELYVVNRMALRELTGMRRLSSEASIIKFLRRKQFDTVICTFREDRFALWAFLSAAKIRVGQNNQGLRWLLTNTPEIEKRDRGVLEYYCDLVRAIGATIDSPKTDFEIPESSRRWADEYLDSLGITGEKKLIGIHPGATGDYKIWPPERYAELMEQLQALPNVRVLLFKGHMDEPIIKAIRKSFRGLVFQAEARAKIGDIAALIHRCSLCISNDSGPRHLAVAVGTPSLALFRKFHDQEWGTYRETNTVATLKGSEQCSACPPGVCLDKVPDGMRFGSYCLRMITVRQVVERVNEILNSPKQM